MRFASALLFVVLLAPRLAGQASTADQWEDRFRTIPDPNLMRQYMEFVTARPHHVGSPYGKTVAEWIHARFTEWGLKSRIETFHVLFPKPTERVVELIAPTPYKALMREPAVDGDPSSLLQDEHLPSYNAYSVDGDVTAPLVYVNYGIPEDYEQLDRMGISVQGAIVIARYGASWRGIKPKLASEKGAVGCIIYSDPAQDGYVQGDVYPKGPFRNSDGVQRGSVMDMPLYPGDPLTPGVPATKEAKRLAREGVKTLTAIPVLPLSYGDAQPLLTALEGPVAPPSWRGGLPITYHVGPGPATVRLAVRSSWELAEIHNVIGLLEGSEHPSEWVIRGNHHDAWVHGAEDPVSALVAMMEEARAFAMLTKSGWKPRRTIIYCAWDGEEQGLLGSTEWVEAHAGELRAKAVAYVGTDGYGRGFLEAGGSHSLEHFMNEVARAVTDPETGLSVWKRSQLKHIADAKTPEARAPLRSAQDLPIEAIGSGSDYTAFLDHAGIASLSLGFGGEDDGGIYHSIYDSYSWFTRFSDTTFAYGKTLAQTAGTAVFRLVQSEVLPFRFSNLAARASKYLDELQSLISSMREAVRERERELSEGLYQAITDPRRPTAIPKPKQVPPHLNFAPLENALERLRASAERYDGLVLAPQSPEAAQPSRETTTRLNQLLLQSERILTHPDGLDKRPWFKHLLYAPGYYTGYGVKTMPGIREALEKEEWALAEREIVRVAGALDNLATLLDKASLELESLSKTR